MLFCSLLWTNSRPKPYRTPLTLILVTGQRPRRWMLCIVMTTGRILKPIFLLSRRLSNITPDVRQWLLRWDCPADMALLRVFFRLVRPTTRNMGQFGAKVLSHSCYCWRRAPRCTYRSADMSIEALVMRLSHRQGPAVCLWRLDVSFESCGPWEPQPTGHHVPHDRGRAANTPSARMRETD